MEGENRYWFGISLAVVTALVWGGTSVFAKLVCAAGVSQVTAMSYRAVAISLLAGGWLYARHGSAPFRQPRELAVSYFLMGLFTVAMNSTSFTLSCNYLSVAQVLILHYTFPLLVMAGSVWVTREPPAAAQVAAAVLILVGLYVGFMLGRGGFAGVSWRGVCWGLLSVAGVTAQTLLSRRLFNQGRRTDPLTQLFYAHFWGGVIIITVNSLFGSWSDVPHITLRGFLLMQYPMLGSGLVGVGLYFASLKYISAAAASLLTALEIVFAQLLAVLLLHQAPSLYEMAGSAIILAAVACSTLKVRLAEAKS